ncbi:alpha/beta hydrolase [Ruegeria sp. AD91A]|uniref:alpha/beta fold hydrolase n=1 Tax=Ruegeria sp. AD91A TaxID=2293862 RepID=UPI000E4CD9D9|nr:alpha/beta hydrolase [Ruegeria sp. AD91A]AXT25546.1 alpha/beta hydrolase [Ruegeria sp. AD91A]
MVETASERPDQTVGNCPVILCIGGFGDNASMFEGLADTHIAENYRLLPFNLPGFGAPPLSGRTTLSALAQFVADRANECEAEIILAHSVASIIASLAAGKPGCSLTTILSLEENITADDAYFSGTAADYDDPASFRRAFLDRLDEMSTTAPIIHRYRQAVSEANPVALWQLGADARRFSAKYEPGMVLQNAAMVTYLYNPENCPKTTIEWLSENPMDRIVLDNATHWASVDQPELLADKILLALSFTEKRSLNART